MSHTGLEDGEARFQAQLSAGLAFAPGDLVSTGDKERSRLASICRLRRRSGLIDRLVPRSCLAPRAQHAIRQAGRAVEQTPGPTIRIGLYGDAGLTPPKASERLAAHP